MEFKTFTHVEFKDSFFTLTFLDGVKLSLSYSKLDVVRHVPEALQLSIVTKGLGTFDKGYESCDHLENDVFALMSRGKSPC